MTLNVSDASPSGSQSSGSDTHSCGAAAPPSYRLVPVVGASRRVLFIILQVGLLAGMLWLAVTLMGMLLPRFFSPSVVFAIIVMTCTLAVLWQALYVYRVLAMRRAIATRTELPTGLRIAMATTIVPSREFGLLEQKLAGMAAVSAGDNALDHWVLDEEDDPRVRKLVAEFNRRYHDRDVRFFHFTRNGVERYNDVPSGRSFRTFQARQKGGNINAWLDATRAESYDLITFMDLDHIPEPDFYRSVLPFFGDPDVAYVQGPEVFRNRDDNFITRAASLERDTFFGLVHRSYFGLGMTVIVGAHTTFRRSAFDALGGFYPVHLTEDYLMMMRLRALGLRGIYVDEVIAVGELPATWDAFLGQQRRWASGGLDLLFRYFPKVWRHYSWKDRLFGFMLLNYYVWGGFFVLGKAVLLGLLITGVALEVGPLMLVGMLCLLLIGVIGNHLWERTFFIQPEHKTYIVQNAVMSNFLGPLYCMSLFKALVAPNTPFEVTAKGRADQGVRRRLSYRSICGVLLGFELLVLVSAWPLLTGAGTGWVDVVQLVLLVSAATTAYVLVAYRRHEKAVSPPVPIRGTSDQGCAGCTCDMPHNPYPPLEPERGFT
ncbi:glycosyltransferase family 2 protein [Halopseudomonas salegens]|uniref:Glycosyltransferase, catalytic subunit of cellulose synthase and poly-beta-1,6-N-acetylglucosamine synthase n=1 Tax=Halopseudomonas salegens TaxID=1434072 RepID=A0A1H2FWH4_9GAMM|nr:glycosyltransferase family 2 protein [Halopseudomonas salegens]SDU11659.1 Glycosyltransferase, catalytic subunit of cellulose synthase and poly-beta-1,6-N-acetylglucosamine synthase [Halopseudomonas salegens]